MKKIILLLFSALPCICFSQKNADSLTFGNISPADLKMSECNFDKNAEAIALFDVEDVDCLIYPGSVYTEITRHVRIKILKDKGLEEANIILPYFSYLKTESIDDIVAQTYNLDASGKVVVVKLDKKSIYDKPLDKHSSQKVFTFPEVKKGSIIEYSYRLNSTLSRRLRNWNFQKAIPVKFSRYSISFPPEIEVYTKPVCSLPVSKETKKVRGEDVYVYTMNNIPALRDEPFITCDDDYLERVESRVIAFNTSLQRISLTQSWKEIVGELMVAEDFGQQLTKNIPRTDSLDAQLKGLKDPYQKMATIFRYVRDKMEWNGETSMWAMEGVKSAWKSKKGTSGEINLILVNLLRDADVPASPVLVSSHTNGMIDLMVPSSTQFDNVMAFVKLNGKVYVLDATDKFASPNIIPWDVSYTQGLVIDKVKTSEWGWQTLWNENQRFNTQILLNASISADGTMKGRSMVNSFEYARSTRRSVLNQGKEKFVDKYFTANNAGIRVDSVSIENELTDTLPLVQNVFFTGSLNSSGNYKYFKTNLFTGLEKNPFTADFRFSDVFFGANQKIMLIGNFELPEGYSLDELPKNIKMITPDTSIVFSRLLEARDNKLMMKTVLEFKRPFYGAGEYDSFREFYQKLFDFLNEQIVLKKS